MINRRSLSLALSIILVLPLLCGCGSGAGSFSSKWEMEINELTGGKPTVHYIDLSVNGPKFYMHRKEPMELSSLGFGGEGTITQECDVVFDGKTLWEFNRKTYYEEGGTGGDSEEWNKEQENMILSMEPDSSALDIIRFWNIPKGLPTEQTGKDKVLGRDVNVLTSKQRSPLGADVVITLWIDPATKVMLKRQDSTGGESSGKGTSDSIFGRKYTCTEFSSNPGFPADRFVYKPKSTDKVEKMERYPFSI